MIESIDYQSVLKGLVVGCLIVIILFLGSFFDARTKIVSCNVGQGDGAYIRIKNRFDVLIDAGPDRKILNCLGKYMPFWDRKIELAIISHPQKDHFGGVLYVMDRYQVEHIVMSHINNPSQLFRQLKAKIRDKKIKIDIPKAGTKIAMMNDSITFYWPTEEFLAKNVAYQKYLAHDLDIDNILGVSSLDDNEFSLVFLFQENGFKALFTGDASPKVLNNLIDSRLRGNDSGGSRNDIERVNILKVPHHGSKNGLTEKFLRLADPRVAVISVGKNNSYGHPSKEVLDMLQSSGIKIKRTDRDGDIIFRLYD